MPAPPALLPAPYHASGSYLRDAFRRVHERLGGDEALFNFAKKNDGNFLEFQKLNVRMQPKEVQLELDNSAEALLSALEAKQRGEIVQYIDEKIDAEDAEFAEIPRSSLWSPRVIAQTVRV